MKLNMPKYQNLYISSSIKFQFLQAQICTLLILVRDPSIESNLNEYPYELNEREQKGKKTLPLREKVVFGETSLNVASLFLAWLFAGLCHLCLLSLSSSLQTHLERGLFVFVLWKLILNRTDLLKLPRH